MNCGPQHEGMDCGPRQGQGQGMNCDMRGGPGKGCGPDMDGGCGEMGARLPEPFDQRVQQIHMDAMKIRKAWIQAVAERGDKSIEKAREAFEKNLKADIEKLKADGERLKEDLAALRQGPDLGFPIGPFRMRFGQNDEGENAAGFGPGPVFGKDDLRDSINAEIAQELNKIKGSIDAESLEKVRREVLARHGDQLRDTLRERLSCLGEGMPPPHMNPDLARMRQAMDDMRNMPVRDRRDFVSQIREAMKIDDRAEREAAIEKIMKDMHDKGGKEQKPEQKPEQKSDKKAK